MRERLKDFLAGLQSEMFDVDGALDELLTELRTPDEAMIEAGAKEDMWVLGEGQCPQPEVFTAMIDAVRGKS